MNFKLVFYVFWCFFGQWFLHKLIETAFHSSKNKFCCHFVWFPLWFGRQKPNKFGGERRRSINPRKSNSMNPHCRGLRLSREHCRWKPSIFSFLSTICSGLWYYVKVEKGQQWRKLWEENNQLNGSAAINQNWNKNLTRIILKNHHESEFSTVALHAMSEHCCLLRPNSLKRKLQPIEP